MRGDGQTLNGLNRRAGMRDRRYRRDSEYRLAPKCPWRGTPRDDGSPAIQERRKARWPPYSAISMKIPVSAQKAEHVGSEETRDECEHSFPTTSDSGGLCLASDEDSAEELDTGATADLVCFRWL